jgi:hypothetical protein
MTSSGLTDVPVMGFTPTAGVGLLVVTQAGWLLTEGSRPARSARAMGVRARGTVGAGVHARDVTSPLSGVTARLDGA